MKNYRYSKNLDEAIDELISLIDAIAASKRSPKGEQDRLKRRAYLKTHRWYEIVSALRAEVDTFRPCAKKPTNAKYREGLLRAGWAAVFVGYESSRIKWPGDIPLIPEATLWGRRRCLTFLDCLQRAEIPHRRHRMYSYQADEELMAPAWAFWCFHKRRTKGAIDMMVRLKNDPETRAALLSAARISRQPVAKNGVDLWLDI